MANDGPENALKKKENINQPVNALRQEAVNANAPANGNLNNNPQEANQLNQAGQRAFVRRSAQEMAEDSIASFEVRIKKEAAESGLRKQIETDSLGELLELMKADSDEKSEGFMSMEKSLERLIKLKAENNEKRKRGQRRIMDYRDALSFAEYSAKAYAMSHMKLFHFTTSGADRYKISCRVSELVARLRESIDNDILRNITEPENEEREFKKQEIESIIETGAFTPEETGKEIKDWLDNSKEYKSALKRLVSGDERINVKDKETLLKFLENKNRLLTANKMALRMAADEHKELTFSIPGMKQRLEEYMSGRLKETPELQEKIFSETDQFRSFLEDCLKSYREENKDLLQHMEEKRGLLLSGLDEDGLDPSFWEREEVGELLTNSSMETFRLRLSELADQKKENSSLVDQIAEERGFSFLTKKAIKQRLKSRMGSLLIFGTETEVADQASRLLESLKFICPIEAEAEERLDLLMWADNIPSVRRDALARRLSGPGGAEAIAKGNMSIFSREAGDFKRETENTVRMIRDSGLMKKKLTRAQWNEIRQLDAKLGTISKNAAAKSLRDILDKNTQGTKISRREYRRGLTGSGRRGIGFSGRILGDQFLDHDDTVSILNDEERRFLRKHLIPALAGDEATLSVLEKSATADIKRIAKDLRETLIENERKIKDLRNGDAPKAVKRRVLLKLLSEGGDFDRIYEEETAEQNAKAAAKEEQQEIRKCISGIPGSADIRLRAAIYENRRDYLKRYENGRYRFLADHFLENTGFYRDMMSLNDDELADFIKERLDKSYRELGEALKAVEVPDAVRQLYIEKKSGGAGADRQKGNVMFFKKDIKSFYRQLLEEKLDDGSSIEKNIEEAYSLAVKELKLNKKGMKDARGGLSFASNSLINRLFKDTEGLNTLRSKDALKTEILGCYRNLMNNRQKAYDRFLARLDERDCPFFRENRNKKGMRTAQFVKYSMESMASKSAPDFEKSLAGLIRDFEEAQNADKEYDEEHSLNEFQRQTLRNDVGERQDAAAAGRRRSRYLLKDNELTMETLKTAYSVKTLANVGREAVTEVSHEAWRIARDHISERLSYLGEHLSPIVIDCLVERNLASFMDEAIDWTPGVKFVVRNFINKGFKKLEEHAKWLARVHEVLSQTDEGEEPVSRDELDLMIVNIYRNDLVFIDEKGRHTFDRKDIKGKWYGRFRKNYAELKRLETMDISDPSLLQERIGLSRDLRALLATGVAISDQSSRARHDFKSLAARSINYVNHMGDFCETADLALKQSEKYGSLDDLTRARLVEGLRKYYDKELMKELEDTGDKAPVFDRVLWESRLLSILKDDVRMRYMRGSEESVSGESYGRKNKNFGETAGMDAIDALISKYAWRSQRKKYNSLSHSQRELFAFALMIMDKGATGTDTGTNRVLNAPELREKEITPRLSELARYMSGKPYDFRIDYAQAYYKLTNRGVSMMNIVETTLSDTAFDKAFEFVEGIHKKMEAASDKDIERAGDAPSAIAEAALLKKTAQTAELDSLSALRFSPEKVKKKLLNYGVRDTASLNEKLGISGSLPLVRRSLKKEQERIDYVIEKLKDMDALDMKRLIAVLQNRTVLDMSVLDKKKSVNQKGYEELALMFSEENETEIHEAYSKDAACYKAMASALSFKIKDDRKLGDRSLTKDDFDPVSFERTGLADWQLLKRALEFIDRMKGERLARLAVRSAADYIEASGNKKAVEEYRKLRDNRTMGQEEAAEYLRQQAEKDTADGQNKDAILAYSGFMRLTEAQRRLFFRVLCHRDLLDISKNNLYRNIYSSSSERSFVNEAGRFRLIDEYIDSSLSGNKGVSLSDTAVYDALRSLLSTQVDDTADFTSAGGVGQVLAGERYFILQRSTAIDWKLFSRALQFVNRASYELKIREGNAELYRSAGELSRFGHMSIDYSILRKNIHSTGNRLLRYGVRRGRKGLTDGIFEQTDIVLPGGVVFPITDIGAALEHISKVAPNSISGFLKELGSGIKGGGNDKPEGPEINAFYFSPDGLNYLIEKSKIPGLGRKLQRYDETTQDKISSAQINIEQNEAFIMKSARELGKILAGFTGGNLPLEDGKKKSDKEGNKKRDILDRQVGSYRVAHRYGDMRDTISSISAKYDKLQELNKKAAKLPVIKNQMIDAQLDAAYLIRGSLVELFGRAISGDRNAPFYSLLEASYERTRKMKLRMIMDGRLPELIKQGKKKKGEGFTEEEIRSHKYWSEEEERLTAADRARAAENVAKDYYFELLNGMFGEDMAKELLEDKKTMQAFTDEIRRKAVWVSHVMGAARVYGGAVMDIVRRTQNLDDLRDAKKRADSKETRDKDKKRLEDSGVHQTEAQKKLAGDTAEHHRDLQSMVLEITKGIQGVNIARDVLSAAVQTGIIVAISSGLAYNAVKSVASAVQAGLDFALYVTRCVKDRRVLADYYRSTEQGRSVALGIMNKADSVFGEEAAKDSRLKNRDGNILEIVTKGLGYEKEEELVTDTGLKLASSIAFSASSYNPVAESRIIASTVMVVLNMRDSIGKTDKNTIQGIYEAMRAA